MKQTLIQQNLDQSSNSDPIYSLYLQEVENRGHKYVGVISMFSNITNGHLSHDAVRQFILRLAFNPSIFSYFQSEDPVATVQSLVEDDLNHVEIDYLYDFIDDISLNVKMKNKDLYLLRQETLIGQIFTVCAPKDEVELDKFKAIIEQLKEYVVTFYYLRKIGYTNELNNISAAKENQPFN